MMAFRSAMRRHAPGGLAIVLGLTLAVLALYRGKLAHDIVGVVPQLLIAIALVGFAGRRLAAAR